MDSSPLYFSIPQTANSICCPPASCSSTICRRAMSRSPSDAAACTVSPARWSSARPLGCVLIVSIPRPRAQKHSHNPNLNENPSQCHTTYISTSFPSSLAAAHRGIISPSVVEHTAHVQVSQDEGAVLLCVAQGCPSPEYRCVWV